MKLTAALKAQIESDIKVCESHMERNGSEALYHELVARYVVVDPSFKNGLSINGKAAIGSEFDFRPELRAIASKLGMYLLTGEAADECNSKLKTQVIEFIERGEEIGKEEFRAPEPGVAMPGIISGPKYDAWMSEINIFNERYLSNHPLHRSIHAAFFHRKTSFSSYEDMMGHLRALAKDDTFWRGIVPEEETMVTRSRKTIDQLLEEDIERCDQYLSRPDDEALGQKLYLEITGRYDRVINGLGNGLYQYYAEQHFYDPEIDKESLIHNLTVLFNKLIAYQAEKYPPVVNVSAKESGQKMSKKVFIVHGHDNEAKQEMARTLTKGGFDPIILHEQPDSGRTIIEKIERFSDVCYAVVLYTECDKGRDKEMPVEKERNRARQNVVFEHGYLIAKLGRDRVSALVKGDVETPGDISGVVYTPMDANGAWKIDLVKNMQDVGLPADMNDFCR